jgi:hypothetical protein
MAGDDGHDRGRMADCLQSKHRREIGFWCFLLSNALWIVWGWHDGAYALIVLQIALAVLNIRGAYKNERESNAKADR